MDEKLKSLSECINALKNGQEETKERMENVQRSQEETKNELKEWRKAKKRLRRKWRICREKINSVEDRIAGKMKEEIAVVEEKVGKEIERIKEQVEEKFEEMARNFSQRVEDLEKTLLVCGKTMKETQFVPASAVYKTQICIISEANGGTEGVKACQLAASLRGEAAEVLQTLPDTKRLNLNSLYNVLDLRFGQKYSKDYARLQMKTRIQKAGEILHEYASEEERLANLAFSDHSATVEK
ncbi:uncharacterized protein TNCV_3412981 [Trichonephila clavipes]|uniref:Uncharacterized protein n=1 Tax=Trichonephila clavipes TaxID=2585209 RepID=A0A8X6RFZ1_TRICX|nr:uncharacterized protein TNCV_3412981 [Trichonephila clavipes]